MGRVARRAPKSSQTEAETQSLGHRRFSATLIRAPYITGDFSAQHGHVALSDDPRHLDLEPRGRSFPAKSEDKSLRSRRQHYAFLAELSPPC